MEKFFIFTQGRTGSTAIADELNRLKTLSVAQELFLDFDNNPELWNGIPTYYKFIEPFDVWKKVRINRMLSVNFLNLFYRHHYKLAERYLIEAEELGRQEMSIGFGFKVLSHHFDQRPFLSDVLARREYRAIFLVRRNIVRTVLSGMIAKQRGVYNSESISPAGDSYPIDLDEFEQRIRFERRSKERNRQKLADAGFDVLEVVYEDFCDNREKFYRNILTFLNIPYQLPPRTSFRVMISDIRHVVSNYNDFEQKVVSMGMGNFLHI